MDRKQGIDPVNVSGCVPRCSPDSSGSSQPFTTNSIKESISAVESTVKLIAKDDKATLGYLLKRMGLHPALEKGFAAIYGYTSDADGIRHGLMDQPTLSAADARFFLVVCSAFVNYASGKVR
jgi:hypothetical protein